MTLSVFIVADSRHLNRILVVNDQTTQRGTNAKKTNKNFLRMTVPSFNVLLFARMFS